MRAVAAVKGSERRQHKLLGLLDEDRPEGILGELDRLASQTGAPVHADLLRLLTHTSFPGDSARRVWSGYQSHRATLRKRLGRDVGARVALFDYLTNVEKRFVNPTVIEFDDFERTERAAITDHLTGLFNRAHFDASLKREINRCLRYGQIASLVMLDLDDFKGINDQHGHTAGDAVLKEVGRLLTQRVRDIDIAARYGGEEFAMILPETPRMSAWVVAERLRNEVDRYFKRRKTAGASIPVTISGGVASYPDDATNVDNLVRRADEALYRAKRIGKNRVEVYFEEKRTASRLPIGSRADIRVRLDGSAAGQCRPLNISAGGILVETTRPPRLGENLAMRVAIQRDKEMSVQGEVVRLEERAAGRSRKLYDVGIRFARGCPRGLSRYLRETATA